MVCEEVVLQHSLVAHAHRLPLALAQLWLPAQLDIQLFISLQLDMGSQLHLNVCVKQQRVQPALSVLQYSLTANAHNLPLALAQLQLPAQLQLHAQLHRHVRLN